jgi:hypothetical protein
MALHEIIMSEIWLSFKVLELVPFYHGPNLFLLFDSKLALNEINFLFSKQN